MKILILCFTVLLHLTATAQSPYLSVNVKMDSVPHDFTNYRISMKICEPMKMSDPGDWFKQDTSSLDFFRLKPADITCGHYSYIEGTDDHPGSDARFNVYNFGNQLFAWEKILVFRISDYSSRGWHPEMYIIIPMKYKSFRTSIDLTGIEFLEGKVIFLSDLKAYYNESGLVINQSLKDAKAVEVRGFQLEKLLEKK